METKERKERKDRKARRERMERREESWVKGSFISNNFVETFLFQSENGRNTSKGREGWTVRKGIKGSETRGKNRKGRKERRPQKMANDGI
jgi:hypothetical protein